MNKKLARDEAWSPDKTWREYREMIVNSDLTGRAKLNKSLTRQQASDIFLKMVDSNKDLDAIPKTLISINFRVSLSGDGVGLMNLLREFG